SATTGINHIDSAYAKKHGIKVISLHGEHTVPTAEHAMALILGLLRNVTHAHNSLSSGNWNRQMFIGRELSKKTLGIIGFGKIGKQVATYAKGFGMRILYYDPYVSGSKLGKKVQF